MGILTAKCPHCGVESVSLNSFGFAVPTESISENKSKVDKGVFVAAYCGKCLMPASAMVKTKLSYPRQIIIDNLREWDHGNYDISHYGYTVIQMWPQPPAPRFPEHLDPRVLRALGQAESNFSIAGNEEAAGMMYRRALEVALDLKFPEVPGMLRQKIKKLVEAGHLLPTLGDWANHVRELGNEAAHEAEGLKRKDLEALREFTDAVLRYAVSLPEEIEKRKAATVR